MDPREFQELAESLANGVSPAEMRTAISRAYYSVYNVGLEMLKGMGFQISEGPSGHKDVEHWLSNCGNITVQKVGSQLAELRSRRIQADYRLDKREVEAPKTARVLVQQASRMIKVLDECGAGPEREDLIRGIREYLEKISWRYC
jgi:hypothetical protein